jgi:2,3-bisphosphoglycerate-independent phosphoglycerate mutase
MSKVMLVIRDGWGHSIKESGNAILQAKTPFDDYLNSLPMKTLLDCSGESVGLPDGFQGSSEVGHLNMGAGRIVEQEVTRIFNSIKNNELFSTDRFNEIRSKLQNDKSALHFVGLLQDEGVHAHQEHLFDLYQSLRDDFPNTTIWIHPIADGRDTPPKSFITFFKQLEEVIKSDQNTLIGTVWGRYYGMDRSKNWKLIKIATDALVHAKGKRTKNFAASIRHAYRHEKTPDDAPMSDEYLKPLILDSYTGMKPGDVMINFNYRQDRAIQISQAFRHPDCPIFLNSKNDFNYYGLTRYYDEFEHFLIPPMTDSDGLKNILSEVLSLYKKSQLRLAETQKFRHVTSFFNGKKTKPFPFEDQVEIDSQWDPSSFASHPEMNAAEVTRELLGRLNDDYDFIAVNYANCDMVGHTGDFDAAQKAVECVDENVKTVAQKALTNGYFVIVTADHGNSEEMFDKNGNPQTAHTVNPVKLHLLAPNNGKAIKFEAQRGILSDIAPLVLKLMNLPVPLEMTSRSLDKALKTNYSCSDES